jgi:hypothetical protein
MPECTNQTILELADDVREMGQRVLDNGGEPHYAREKLARAATRAITALTLLGTESAEITALVDDAETHGHWLAGRS